MKLGGCVIARSPSTSLRYAQDRLRDEAIPRKTELASLGSQ